MQRSIEHLHPFACFPVVSMDKHLAIVASDTCHMPTTPEATNSSYFFESVWCIAKCSKCSEKSQTHVKVDSLVDFVENGPPVQ